MDKNTYQSTYQIEGTNAHKTIDSGNYSTRKNILQGINIYCEKYRIQGKIDIFDIDKGVLTERKRSITKIYDGYIFQLYAQYYALVEMGYKVSKIRFHSIVDNKNYNIKLPSDDIEMREKFENLIKSIREFEIENFKQENIEKCKKCIYEPSCDRSLVC